MIDLAFAHYFPLFRTLVIGVWLGKTSVTHLSGALVCQDADAGSGFSLGEQLQLQRTVDVQLHL